MSTPPLLFTRKPLARVAIHLALFLACLPLFAQQTGQPFQATLTKASHVSGASMIFMDLPVPLPGHRLTINRVSVKVGPKQNPYTTVFACFIESDRPAIPDTEFLVKPTRVHLKAPEFFTHSSVWYIPNEQTLIFYDNYLAAGRTVFRLTCEADFVTPTLPLSVTVTGYTTPLP